ncbi:topoisomerase DNA-binding C4 zinc finger domain-containing protein [Moritella sp. 24]|uniref:DNA topoisomerase family protein n=1 Tax=Moritella sp. 24 TaxID=2746230 RepID=UPI001BA666D7|nr:topoisomerase DNA-binding C4 zinc finger domain-containing protein [Moritella sp. 24]QUM78358.1 topoisomerase DNA-binding C4 zinc finger domain-containing protein [Moritella sp. 24]
MSKSDDKLFTVHEHALEKEYETCPQCGAELSIKNSKSGPFLGCNNYPTCEYSRPLSNQSHFEDDKVLAGSVCPECQHELALKRGRYGFFIGCTQFPACNYMSKTETPDETGICCPQCKSGDLMQKKSRYGKIFYSCNKYPQCKYIINFKPVSESCPECQWAILVEKKTSNGKQLICPQKKCGYKRALLE